MIQTYLSLYKGLVQQRFHQEALHGRVRHPATRGRADSIGHVVRRHVMLPVHVVLPGHVMGGQVRL